MKIVVDSNILFTYFWKSSITRELFVNQDLQLYSPEFSLKELDKHSERVIKDAKISKEQFNAIKEELMTLIEFISLEQYSAFLKDAFNIPPDKEDLDFVALALKLNCSIWSNDNKLKEQKHVKIITTEEIIELFD